MGFSSLNFSGGLRKTFFRKTAFWLFKVSQGHWFWHQSKARMWLQSVIVTLVLSCTVSEILHVFLCSWPQPYSTPYFWGVLVGR